MFGDVVEPSIKVGSQKWYTVPLSIVVHTGIIGAVIIIPLMAADVLPSPPNMMNAFVAAPPPPPPATATTSSSGSRAGAEAADGCEPRRGSGRSSQRNQT